MPTSGRAHSALHETPATYALPATAEQTDPSRLGGRAMLAPGETVNDRVTAAPDTAPPVAATPRVDPATLDATADAMSYTPGAGRWVARRIGTAGGSDRLAGPAAGRDVLGSLGGVVATAVVGRYVAGPAPYGSALWPPWSHWPSVCGLVSMGGGRRQTALGVHRPDDDPDTRPVVPGPGVRQRSRHRGQCPAELERGEAEVRVVRRLPGRQHHPQDPDQRRGSGNDPQQFLRVAEHGLETAVDVQGLPASRPDGHDARRPRRCHPRIHVRLRAPNGMASGPQRR